MANVSATMTPSTDQRSRVASLLDGASAKVILPILTMALVLVAWEYFCILLEIPPYLVPKPTEVLGRFYTDFANIGYHMWATSKVILMAFVFAGIIGVTMGYMIVTFATLERGAYPLIVFLEIIPKTITAPLFVAWFGVGLSSKLMLTTFIAFFPILVNSIAGFRSIDPRLYHISRSMGANWSQTFRFIQYPAALPYIFAGLKIASVYAVTASIVIEFVGSTEGLGYLIIEAMAFMDMELMFAAILATALTGLLFNLVVTSFERLVIPWMQYRQ